MKTFAPNYYEKFRCIAGRCRHSCCIGWEIYIDEETLAKYKAIGGALGARLAENICENEDGACFRMGEGERCPFLNERGLCDIILTKGEGYISEICTEHPRFYNFFSDRTEVGLGLCCEEAARIILSQNEKFSLVTLDDDGEKDELSLRDAAFFERREQIFKILQADGENIDKKAQKMLAFAGANVPKKSMREWAEVFTGLEMLDTSWGKTLTTLGNGEENMAELDGAFEKLLIYFVYRHTAEYFDEADLAARIAFAHLGFTIIRALCSAKKAHSGRCTFADLCDLARRYSAEIEYSEENTAALIEILS